MKHGFRRRLGSRKKKGGRKDPPFLAGIHRHKGEKKGKKKKTGGEGRVRRLAKKIKEHFDGGEKCLAILEEGREKNGRPLTLIKKENGGGRRCEWEPF